jgi:hypothetical protein
MSVSKGVDFGLRWIVGERGGDVGWLGGLVRLGSEVMG